MKRALIVLTGTTVSVVAALNYTPHQILAPINDQTAIGTDGFSFADPSPVPTSSANSSASPSPSITITKPKTTDTKKPAVVSPKNSSAPTQKKAPKVIPVVPKQKPPLVPQPVQSTPVPVAPKIVMITGDAVDTPYGAIQVAAQVDSTGKIYDVAALKYPNADSRSASINAQAIPRLRQETLSAQSANISMVSGASYTSQGWVASLQSLLTKT